MRQRQYGRFFLRTVTIASPYLRCYARQWEERFVLTSNEVTLNVVNSIKGDPNYGENSALYAALGYVRKDDRKSGLTRKSVEPTDAKAA